MGAKATLKQIAKDLGVSVSTVSKALSDSPEISETTKQRIQEYARLQNYTPNKLAKSLKTQRTYTLGVVVPNMMNPFFAKVFHGIEKTANEKGYNVITYISNESHRKEQQAIELLSHGTVDGFILSVAEETQKLHAYSHFQSAIGSGIPIVMFDRTTDEVACDKVVVDDMESSVSALQYMYDTGCRRFVLVSSIGNISVGKLRQQGFDKALSALSGVSQRTLIANDMEAFDAQSAAFLAEAPFDAVFACDEHSSTAVMKWAVKQGLRIPDEVSIIGFADGIWSRRLTPSLSTISQHGPEIGAEAAKLLIQRIEQGSKQDLPYRITVVQTELRKRDSVRK